MIQAIRTQVITLVIRGKSGEREIAPHIDKGSTTHN